MVSSLINVRSTENKCLYYQNVRGLRTKTNETLSSVSAVNYDYLVFTETWLTNDIFSNELFPPNYQVYRQDRDYDAFNCTRGGGVLIAVSNLVPSGKLKGSSSLHSEVLWVKTNDNIILGAIYISPSSPPDVYTAFIDSVEQIRDNNPNSKLLIAGDFNLPMLEWFYEDGMLLPMELRGDSAEILVGHMFYLELKQVNSIRNNLNRTLDLILCDEFEGLMVRRASELCKLDKLHPALEIGFNTENLLLSSSKVNVTVHQFDKADYDRVNSFLGSLDWSFVDTVGDVNIMVDRLHEVLQDAVDKFVPSRIISENKYPKWYSAELKGLINRKNKMYKRYKFSNNPADYERYSLLRRETKFQIDLCYMIYVSNTECMIPDNIKYFWSFVNSLRKDNNGIPLRMTYEDSEYNCVQDIADAFARKFRNDYSDHTLAEIPSIGNIFDSVHLSTHIFTAEEVEHKIKSLDCKKNAGPDGLSPLFIKGCVSSLAAPLRTIFQRSLSSGIFPTKWKQSVLFPIYKSGNRNDINNYRGISLLCILGKIFESIVTDELFQSFKYHLMPEQHGFFKGRSTVTNLAIYQSYIVQNLEEGYQVDAIYTDISKAFDSVCHKILIHKLKIWGVQDPYLAWISSYLSDRRQCVKLCGAVSEQFYVPSGVPQGSHLGPILFLIFINDIAHTFKHCHFLLYADDLKFFTSVNSHEDCVVVQEDLESMLRWCDANHLKLNIGKCKIMRFHRKREPIIYQYRMCDIDLESVVSIGDLGIIFDKEVNFNQHIDKTVMRAFRMLGFIKRNSIHLEDTKALKTLYNSLVRSILEYGSIIWHPIYQRHIDKLERVQSKFTKYMLFKHRFDYSNVSRDARLLLVGYSSLEVRRCNFFLFFLYKLLNNQVDCQCLLNNINFRTPSRYTRQRQLFGIPRHRTNYGSRCFIDQMISVYNEKFPEVDIFNLSFYQLKRTVLYR